MKLELPEFRLLNNTSKLPPNLAEKAVIPTNPTQHIGQVSKRHLVHSRASKRREGQATYIKRIWSLLGLSVFFTSCVASLDINQGCKQVTDQVKVCRDSRYSETHCRLHITRKSPYPSTITEKFLCEGVY